VTVAAIPAPRVTAILATYNWSSVLPYSIGSALQQTFADFELLVVGDGCTDDSEEVVRRIPDPRVRWINLAENTGHQSGPNNEGLRQARGEVIAYLGHDDLWLPHHLSSIVNAFDETKCDLAYGLLANIGPNDSFIWPAVPQERFGSFSSPCCMAHRRRVTETIGGWRHYRELGTIPPDVELWRRAQRAGCTFTFVPRLTALKFPAGWRRDVYRIRPCHEQAAWLQRIETERDLEQRLLVRLVTSDHLAGGMPYRDLVRHFVRQTWMRFRRRWKLPWLHRNAGALRTIDDIRRFKGL
jgi:glycosyltransferase involved in cell wall biosynthesis